MSHDTTVTSADDTQVTVLYKKLDAR